MRPGALARPGGKPGIWAAGGGGRGRPGPGSPEQQAGAERSWVLQPPRSREPGQPPPAVMSAGPLLKGQAARRGSERGLGAVGTGGVLGVTEGAPASNCTESRKPKSLQGRRDAGTPQGRLRGFGAQSPPNIQTQARPPDGLLPCRDYISHQPWARGRTWGEGSVAVPAGTCSLLGPSSPLPPLASGSRETRGGRVCPPSACVAGSGCCASSAVRSHPLTESLSWELAFIAPRDRRSVGLRVCAWLCRALLREGVCARGLHPALPVAHRRTSASARGRLGSLCGSLCVGVFLPLRSHALGSFSLYGSLRFLSLRPPPLPACLFFQFTVTVPRPHPIILQA